MGHSKLLLALGAMSLSLTGFSQDELGLRSSNFSGTNRLFLNPASVVNSPIKWNFHVVSVGVFANNRYAYIENSSGINAIKNLGSLQMRPENTEGVHVDNPEDLYYNFYDAERKMGNSLNAFATLPSFVFQKNGRSFGLLLNARVAVSANRIDPDLDYFSIQNWNLTETKNIDKIKTAGMAWAEIGLHYGQNIFKNDRGELNLGGNLKYLMGTDAYFVKSTALSDITKFSDSITLSNSSVKYGIATGMENDLSSYNFQANGHGIGLDLGLEYKVLSSKNDKPYDWKFGVSLMDIGFIHFGKNAQKHEISLQETFDVATASYEDIESIQDLYSVNSTEVLNDPLQSKVADKFNILTPAGISIQADYAVHKIFYVNATFNRRIRFFGPQVERENFFSLSPRIEHKWFEFGLPLVLYNDVEPRLGAWVRLAYLSIGSDNFSSLVFKQKQLHGTDIYVSLSINGFGRKKGKGKNGRSRNNDEYGCYF